MPGESLKVELLIMGEKCQNYSLKGFSLNNRPTATFNMPCGGKTVNEITIKGGFTVICLLFK